MSYMRLLHDRLYVVMTVHHLVFIFLLTLNSENSSPASKCIIHQVTRLHLCSSVLDFSDLKSFQDIYHQIKSFYKCDRR